MGLVVKVGEGSVTGNGGSSTDRETRGCQINGSSELIAGLLIERRLTEVES